MKGAGDKGFYAVACRFKEKYTSTQKYHNLNTLTIPPALRKTIFYLYFHVYSLCKSVSILKKRRRKRQPKGRLR